MNVPDSYRAGIDAALANIAACGPSFTGVERCAIAETGRSASAGQWVEAATAPLRTPVTEAAVMVATRSFDIRETHVAAWERAGLTRVAYVEVLGVVSRIRAIDTFMFGLGLAPPDLPGSMPGPPTGDIAEGSEIRTGFVPVPKLLTPSRTVSALPADHLAQDALMETLYLSVAGMEDLSVVKDLDRSQLELVAARTSFVNDCFW